MFYRRSGQLALQTALLLALEPPGRLRPIRELAETLGVATAYLTKIVQSLTRVGLVRSARGPAGGIQLARPAEEIFPWDVLFAVEPAAEFTRCLLGTGQCNDAAPCPLHEAWAPARNRIRDLLQSKDLRQFATEASQNGQPFWGVEAGFEVSRLDDPAEGRNPKTLEEE